MKWQLGDAVKLVLQASGIDGASSNHPPFPPSPSGAAHSAFTGKRAYIKSLPAKYQHIPRQSKRADAFRVFKTSGFYFLKIIFALNLRRSAVGMSLDLLNIDVKFAVFLM